MGRASHVPDSVAAPVAAVGGSAVTADGAPSTVFVGTPAAAPVGALSVASDVTPAQLELLLLSLMALLIQLKLLLLPLLALLLKLEQLLIVFLIWVSPADVHVVAILKPAHGASCW